MTGPAIQDPTKPGKPAHIMSGDEWEQSLYAPHRLGQDPKEPMGGGRILTGDEWEQAQSAADFGSLKFPAMPKIAPMASDATRRLNPNAGPPDRSIPEQLGGAVRGVAAGFDAAALGLDPTSAAAAHVLAAVGRQAVAPAVEHPLLTAALANPVGAVIGTGMAVSTIAQYGWRKAHEAVMSPEERARSEADPNRVSGEAAAVQAAMLGLGALSGIHALTKAADVSQGLMESGVEGVKGVDFGPRFGLGVAESASDAAKADILRRQIAEHAEGVRQDAAMQAEVTRQNAELRAGVIEAERAGDAAKADELRRQIAEHTRLNAEELRQEELTRQAALRALTGIRRRPGGVPPTGEPPVAPNVRPLLYFESPKGAEVLGTAAAQHGLPETASPYPTATPLDAAWKAAHQAATQQAYPEGFTMGGGLAENRIPSDFVPPKLPRSEPSGQLPLSGEPVVAPTAPAEAPVLQSRGPAALYARLSNDALGAEYRSLLEKRTQEQPNAVAPMWTPEREAAAVEAIENRRRPDGSLAAADKRQLDALQAAQGEGYYEGRHTPESAAAERRLAVVDRHIAAIEQEIGNRGLKSEDVVQPPAVGGGGGGLAPVEGTGEVKTRGLSLGVEAKAVQNKLDPLDQLPEYRQVSMADQAVRATRLLTENPELARKIAMGEADAPKDLLPESVFVAVENRALAEGDVATIRDLASGKLTEQATTMGQRIRTLAERDPDSPVAAIQDITEARSARATGKPVESAIAELQRQLAKGATIDEGVWTKFINSLRC